MKRVTAAIICKDQKVLLARRRDGEALSGFWEFPGGKIHEGETPQACLERELNEELGLETQAGRTLAVSEHRYEHGHFELIALETRILRGEIELRVHDKTEWVPLDSLTQYQLAPADIPIARKLLEVRDDL